MIVKLNRFIPVMVFITLSENHRQKSGRKKSLYMVCAFGRKREMRKKTRSMVNNHIDHSLFTRCIVPYRRKRESHKGMNMFVEKLLFSSYIFIESNNINDFAKCLKCYPRKTLFCAQGIFFCPIYEEEEYFLTDMFRKTTLLILPPAIWKATGLRLFPDRCRVMKIGSKKWFGGRASRFWRWHSMNAKWKRP